MEVYYLLLSLIIFFLIFIHIKFAVTIRNLNQIFSVTVNFGWFVFLLLYFKDKPTIKVYKEYIGGL